MNHDDEIAALRQHFDKRGIDDADAASVITTWLGITIGLAAADDGDVEARMIHVTGWIRDAAHRIVRSLRGQSGDRLQ